VGHRAGEEDACQPARRTLFLSKSFWSGYSSTAPSSRSATALFGSKLLRDFSARPAELGRHLMELLKLTFSTLVGLPACGRGGFDAKEPSFSGCSLGAVARLLPAADLQCFQECKFQTDCRDRRAKHLHQAPSILKEAFLTSTK
jgi:hypothetical protein